MGATGDAEQPRGPGGTERGGSELGDASAAGQLVLTVRRLWGGRARPRLGRAAPRAPGTLARGRENAAAGAAEGLAFPRPGRLHSDGGCPPR